MSKMTTAHPFSLTKIQEQRVNGGYKEGGCIITPLEGENGGSHDIFK